MLGMWSRKELRSSWSWQKGVFVRTLAPIEGGRIDYGVRLGFKRVPSVKLEFVSTDGAVVYSDVLSGQGASVPFRRTFLATNVISQVRLTPVGSISSPDDVLVGPSRLAVNYAAFETFDWCLPGCLPDGWKGTNAAVVAHNFTVHRGRQPVNVPAQDPLLAVGPNGRASLSLAGLKGVTAVSFQLQADTSQDAVVSLPNGLRIGFSGLKMTERHSGRELYSAWEGVWYNVRFEIDGKRVRVKLNGREIAQCESDVDRTGRLDFGSRGEKPLLIDDVKVFELVRFDDGVPEPKVPSDSRGNLVGINVCPLWHEGSHLGWKLIETHNGPRPVLGWYDEGEGETADWEIKYLVEHGIDFQAFCWYAETNESPIRHPQLRYQLDDGFKNARWSDKMKYCLIWEAANAGVPWTAEAWRRNFAPYLIEHHFKDPRYLTIRNKVVLFGFEATWRLKERAGGDTAKVRAEFDWLDGELRKLGFDGLLLVMSNEGGREDYAQMGWRGSSSYNWGSDGCKVEYNVACNLKRAEKNALAYAIPTVSVGFNNEPWGGKRHPLMSPDDFRRTLEWARDTYEPQFAEKGTWQEKLFMISTWNEYGEGTYIMPTRDVRGFGYLDAVRSVFTDERPDPSLNRIPTARQLRRINRLYPQEKENR